MTQVYLFPGQGAQFVGMAQSLLNNDHDSTLVERRFSQAKEILGFDIQSVMTDGTADDLKETKVTQPAIFLYSVILGQLQETFLPSAVAGHSLGEFSALTMAGYLTFEEGLALVSTRALAMQKACEITNGTMAAILGLDDVAVKKICDDIDDTVVAANYNCPGQLVISGTKTGVEQAMAAAKEVGAKRAIPLVVGGAFHSPLMEPARVELAEGINRARFGDGICPIYQNVSAQPSSDIEVIKDNLIQQLTSPVKWTQTIQTMCDNQMDHFVECGPGKVLQGLVKKINRQAVVTSCG